MNAAPTMAIIRAEDMALVQGDHCAAMILNLLRFWQGDREWVQATLEEIRVGILSAYGKTRIAAALKLLRENGLVNAQHNPDFGQVRTLQYQVVGYEAREGSPRRGAPVYQNVAVDEPDVKSEPSETGFDMPESDTCSLYKESDSESWKESSPRVREGDEPTHGDDDDDCPDWVQAEIDQITAQIGAPRVRDVLNRCEGKARSWHYVIKALRNEMQQKRPSPSSAAPLPSAADYAKYATPADWSYQGWAGGAA